MVKISFETPGVDIFDPSLNADNQAAYQWDEAYDRLDSQGQLSASEIREKIGSRPNETIINRPEQTGLYVTLEDRAVALAGIVRYLNKANQVHGGVTGGEGQMRRRYKEDYEGVQTGAHRNRDALIGEFRRGTRVLAATDALSAYGYDEYAVEERRVAIQGEINQRLGVGKEYANVRNRTAQKARDIADVVAGRKKPLQ